MAVVTDVREVGPDELLATSDHPFVRHQVDPATTRRAWVSGRAVVVHGTRGRPGVAATGPVLTCLGPPDDLAPLMRSLAPHIERPARLNVEEASYAVVPDAWRYARHGHWHWMLTREPCEPPAPPVEEVQDAGEIDDLLDVANPDSFARPGTPGVECWLGVRDHGRLVGVGALTRQPDGTGHLRGISVLPTHAGRGLGRAVSAGLTLRALASGPGVATLGVYVTNAPAIAIYHRLRYAVVNTFLSGPTNR